MPVQQYSANASSSNRVCSILINTAGSYILRSLLVPATKFNTILYYAGIQELSDGTAYIIQPYVTYGGNTTYDGNHNQQTSNDQQWLDPHKTFNGSQIKCKYMTITE
jgi:hypothetical protein